MQSSGFYTQTDMTKGTEEAKVCDETSFKKKKRAPMTVKDDSKLEDLRQDAENEADAASVLL